jgi:hypothetical protein
MALDVVETVRPIGPAEVEAAHLARDRKPVTSSLIEFTAAKLWIPLAKQMSAERHTTLPCRKIHWI